MSWAIEVAEILGEERLIRDVLAEAGMYIVQGPTSLLLGGKAFSQCPQPRDARRLANSTSNRLRLVSAFRPEIQLDFRVTKKFFEHSNSEAPAAALPDSNLAAEQAYRERLRVAARYSRVLMSDSMASHVVSTVGTGAPIDILVTVVKQIREELGDGFAGLASEAEWNRFGIAGLYPLNEWATEEQAMRPDEALRFARRVVDRWLELRERESSETVQS